MKKAKIAAQGKMIPSSIMRNLSPEAGACIGFARFGRDERGNNCPPSSAHGSAESAVRQLKFRERVYQQNAQEGAKPSIFSRKRKGWNK